MTRPTIQAIIEDGPRAGETVELGATGDGEAPPEFVLGDEHFGARAAEERDTPSGGVSTYRLVGPDEQRGGYVYRLVPRS